MTDRQVRRFVDDLLHGRSTASFRPDDAEVAELRTAIELRAARPGSGQPSEEFLASLHRRLDAELATGADPAPVTGMSGTRRHVLGGVSIAAAAAVVGAVVDRAVIGGGQQPITAEPPAVLDPVRAQWRPVAPSSDVPDGAVHAFDVGTVNGFVRRVDGKLDAVSGICTHQGCRLWLDAPNQMLRCPCHLTSFTPAGQVATHQLPAAPPPLPHIQVRDNAGTVEVLAPAEPA
ncbi:Rieske (2Fe-2S) protein [Nocardia stercoris]|uniref:Rieske (2Fe-2S) protein n=1 Tax=Nocardia stercoris TaxID=2483361 RepID=A0A3M2L0S8_9NOCA|nr:Rieske (2Fe-2S) protein [Nocardia stercoris]RMI30556.1 Rieske (2Fe-2S) protein [Nocardia stercoris]